LIKKKEDIEYLTVIFYKDKREFPTLKQLDRMGITRGILRGVYGRERAYEKLINSITKLIDDSELL
jgi:hypothetical protein